MILKSQQYNKAKNFSRKILSFLKYEKRPLKYIVMFEIFYLCPTSYSFFSVSSSQGEKNTQADMDDGTLKKILNVDENLIYSGGI